MAHICGAVPPYILDALAKSSDPELRKLGISTKAITQACHEGRHALSSTSPTNRCHLEGYDAAPDTLAKRDVDDTTATSMTATITSPRPEFAFIREIYDMQNEDDKASLPTPPSTRPSATPSPCWRSSRMSLATTL